MEQSVKYDIFSEEDHWCPITWCDSREEAVSFCKAYAHLTGKCYGIHARNDDDFRKEWYGTSGFIGCVM